MRMHLADLQLPGVQLTEAPGLCSESIMAFSHGLLPANDSMAVSSQVSSQKTQDSSNSQLHLAELSLDYSVV